MSADRRFAFVVPAFAGRHRHPMVKEAIELARDAFHDRCDLRRARRDRWGNVTREPLHMFLFRPKGRPATRKDGAAYRSPEDLEGRRADHLQVQLALWVTMVAVADFDTWELLEPDHEIAKISPHPTMLRLAELADLVPPDHQLDDAPDAVWRARNELEKSGVISFTKEWRVEKEDGSHYSNGGALRRLGRKVLAAIGGGFGRAVLDQYAETKRRRAQRAQDAAEFKNRVDALWTEEARAAAAAGAPEAPAVPESAEDAEISRVHEENPSWSWSKTLAEARRRLAELARAGPPTTDTG